MALEQVVQFSQYLLLKTGIPLLAQRRGLLGIVDLRLAVSGRAVRRRQERGNGVYHLAVLNVNRRSHAGKVILGQRRFGRVAGKGHSRVVVADVVSEVPLLLRQGRCESGAE